MKLILFLTVVFFGYIALLNHQETKQEHKLNSYGYCIAKKRFLTDEDFIRIRVKTMLFYISVQEKYLKGQREGMPFELSFTNLI